jgi:integrase
MKAPRRPPARSKKGAGQVAAVERSLVEASPKRVRAVSKARKRRAEAPAPQTGMQLHTADGIRKYLTTGERDAFLREAERADRPVRTLCMTLAYAGCRLSEALVLTADRVDLAAGVLVFESH